MDGDESPRKRRKVEPENDDFSAEGTCKTALSKPVDAANGLDEDDKAFVSEDDENDVSSANGGVSIPAGVDEDGTPLSKNQLKKLRRRQEWEAGRDYRRAKRKQKTIEKKARKRAAKEEQTGNGNEASKERRQRPVRLPISFIIDCGFDELMSEKERTSLGAQLTRAYSDNFRAPYQGHLVVSSWGGKLKERFDTVLSKHHENWKGVSFDAENFVHAIELAKGRMSGSRGGRLAAVFDKYAKEDTNVKTDGVAMSGSGGPQTGENHEGDSIEPAPEHDHLSDNAGQSQPTQEPPQRLPEPEVIYLTSDSPDTLEELKPYSTYIIGGLVDKNRHKGICYRTACDNNVKTAKLPIGEFMEMQSRFVLATNHVVEIMVRWLECGDWGEAFMRVIPKRKGGKLRDPAAANEKGEEDEDEKDDSQPEELGS